MVPFALGAHDDIRVAVDGDRILAHSQLPLALDIVVVREAEAIAAFARLSSDPSATFAAAPYLEAAGLPALGIGAAALALALAAGVARLAMAASGEAGAPRPTRERGKREWYAHFEVRVAKVERAYGGPGRE